MPWREVLAVEERVDFVREYELGFDSMAELARRYHVTPKTGYKWLGRYADGGVAAVVDQSRRPHRNRRAFPAAVIDQLIVARRAHPQWGAAKLLAWVAARDPATQWPKRATVCDRLQRAGLVPKRRRRASRREVRAAG
jgi:putative transposase